MGVAVNGDTLVKQLFTHPVAGLAFGKLFASFYCVGHRTNAVDYRQDCAHHLRVWIAPAGTNIAERGSIDDWFKK